MASPQLSIIVPVYNVEKYLARCIDSILNQSFTDFELLLIDDGSKDSSGSICDAYAEKDSRIRVFHKENGGVSSARNVGLDNANGEWIYFVDSDDELKDSGIKTMIGCISDEVDMVLAGIEEYFEDGSLIYSVSVKINELMSPSESVQICYEKYSRYYRYLGYMCIRLFRKKIIEDHRIRFDESISVKEDTLFIIQYLCNCSGKTFFTTEPVYKYHRHSTSVMTSLWGKWDNKYVSSFYAIQKMLYSIKSSFPKNKKLIRIAKEEEIDRYEKILHKQKEFGQEDRIMQKKLFNDMAADLGLFFIVRYKSKAVTSKIIRKIKRYLSC